jgi:hypothetical protein
MTEPDLLKGGRGAFRQQDWQKAFMLLSAADEKNGLAPTAYAYKYHLA